MEVSGAGFPQHRCVAELICGRPKGKLESALMDFGHEETGPFDLGEPTTSLVTETSFVQK